MTDFDLDLFPAQVGERISIWAPLPHPVLLVGERGTGKSTLAAHLHRESGRSGSMVEVLIPQLPAGLEAGELLGHTRGSFTGAVGDQHGSFERAHRGTLFLEELGLASRTVQLILLNLLDRNVVTRVGASRGHHVDLRVVAATNIDLEDLVQRGGFAADLLDRFGHYRMLLPPLRERRGVILPLVRRGLEREWRRLGRTDVAELTPPVAQVLMRAPWAGNLRDVQSVCAYLAGNAGQVIRVDDLPPVFLATVGVRAGDLEDDQARIRRVIAESGGNHTLAARRLGMSRATLYRRLGQGSGGSERRG